MHVDGVMLGRAAYHTPDVLLGVDPRFHGVDAPVQSSVQAVDEMMGYIAQELARGTRLSHITRHMLGLFHGRAGARTWRRILTVGAVAPGAGLEVVTDALAALGRQKDVEDQRFATAAA